MLLKNLIKNNSSFSKSININGLALDSRKVKKDDLFFALPGKKVDGNKFILEAIKRGASAVISSTDKNLNYGKVPIVKVKNIKKSLSDCCKIFYKNKPKNILAVTGTNGKSSVADFFYQILELNNVNAASIGTLGIKRKGKYKKIDLTSPDIISLHKELVLLKKDKINNVIIEASSHGLDQGRLDGINFRAGIFTNLSQDHLDYHKNMKNYFNAKMILFSKILKKNKLVITDQNIKQFNKIKKISKKNKLKLSFINNEDYFKKRFNLIGNFQIKNLKMAILAAKACGIKTKHSLNIIDKIKSVKGRLELTKILPNKAKVFIDYAHSPDALLNSLVSLKDNFNLPITLVFGCGGERDKNKRKKMANIAKYYSSKIYVTDDNPRNENAKNIRKTIIKYLKPNSYEEIGNRKKAIEVAIKNAKPFEIILIAGKGHEAEQHYKHKTLNISDKQIIDNFKVKSLKINKFNSNFYFNSSILNDLTNKREKFFKGVTFNSKEVKKGNLFIAIKGPKNNGHQFISEAIKNGANFCVISEKIKILKKKKLIMCSDTRQFLNCLAVLKRKKTSSKIIAITGSSGKTTAKNLLGNILKNFGNTYYSPKSYNNHFGVPYSLSNIEHDHKYSVLEIGMNKPGEINNLSKIVKPHIAIITNVGEAHIENFKNKDGIAKAKSEIIDNIEKGGTLIINKDDSYYNFFKKKAERNKIKVVSFSKKKKADIYLKSIKKKKNSFVLNIKVIDQHLDIKTKNINILNILSTLAVLNELKIELVKVQNLFKLAEPLEGRGKIYKINRYKKNFKLIDESYNANPQSMKNAIINLANLKNENTKKYLLLGDMLELGSKTIHYHKNLAKIINKTNIDKIFIFGNSILSTYSSIIDKKKGNILQNINDFDEIFCQVLKKNDYLMIKGSNATGLNKVSKSLIKGLANVI